MVKIIDENRQNKRSSAPPKQAAELPVPCRMIQ